MGILFIIINTRFHVDLIREGYCIAPSVYISSQESFLEHLCEVRRSWCVLYVVLVMVQACCIHMLTISNLIYRMAKRIIDAVLGLNLDDTPSNLAAAALFFVLTNDVSCFHSL